MPRGCLLSRVADPDVVVGCGSVFRIKSDPNPYLDSDCIRIQSENPYSDPDFDSFVFDGWIYFFSRVGSDSFSGVGFMYGSFSRVGSW